MKNYFLLFLLAIVSLTSCEKSCMKEGSAELIGIDFRKCASPFCGGWFIEIEGDTLKFFEMPDETDIEFNENLEFPIPVNVVWGKYENEWKDVPDLIHVKKIFLKD